MKRSGEIAELDDKLKALKLTRKVRVRDASSWLQPDGFSSPTTLPVPEFVEATMSSYSHPSPIVQYAEPNPQQLTASLVDSQLAETYIEGGLSNALQGTHLGTITTYTPSAHARRRLLNQSSRQPVLSLKLVIPERLPTPELLSPESSSDVSSSLSLLTPTSATLSSLDTPVSVCDRVLPPVVMFKQSRNAKKALELEPAAI